MPTALAPADHTTAGIAQSWDNLSRAGGWFTAEERLSIAAAAREAKDCAFCIERKAALSPNSANGTHTNTSAPLNSAQLDTIHRITTDPGRLSQTWYDAALAGGLEPEEIVEITSIVGLITIADTNARALGNERLALPASAADAGAPHRKRVHGLSTEGGWSPMVTPDAAEGMTKTLYEGVQAQAGFVFNVARALSSVPEAIRDFFGAFFPNYSTHGDVRAGGLTRPQVELLASTTSAYNDCFY